MYHYYIFNLLHQSLHNHHVELIYLTISYRVIVAYTDEERLIGDSAVNQQKKNFKNTLQFFPRFLGLNTDCVEQLKEEEKFTTYKIVPLENKKIGFEVTVRGTT